MKKFLILFIFIFSSLISCTSEETKTTYYLIRHAEKDRTDAANKDPNLNRKGLERAERWADYFEKINLNAIYSTNYHRTMQTAEPTAKSKQLAINNYDTRDMYDSIFQNNTAGKTVLVVGHSNTTPIFVNNILGEEKHKNMDDHDNASLYIVTITDGKKRSKIEKVE